MLTAVALCDAQVTGGLCVNPVHTNDREKRIKEADLTIRQERERERERERGLTHKEERIREKNCNSHKQMNMEGGKDFSRSDTRHLVPSVILKGIREAAVN